MTIRARRGRTILSATLLLTALFAGVVAGRADAASPGYSGRAAVVDATVLGQHIVLSDTGPLPASGGAQEASLLEAEVPGLLTAEVLHASTVGQGNQSRSEASVANLALTVGGNTVAADFLMARATAQCNGGNASVSGSADIVNLVVNGQAVTVSGAPNQTIPLPGGGSIVINEQTSSVSGNTGAITVNALHVSVPGVADVIISSAHADITCPTGCSSKNDFVTGGGFILNKDTFAVAGGMKNGGLWGHLQYIDHTAGMKVHGTGVTAYEVTGATSRHIEGTAEVNGVPGFTYQVDVADNGEPGRSDTFWLRLSSGYTSGPATLGGNIQLHKPC